MKRKECKVGDLVQSTGLDDKVDGYTGVILKRKLFGAIVMWVMDDGDICIHWSVPYKKIGGAL